MLSRQEKRTWLTLFRTCSCMHIQIIQSIIDILRTAFQPPPRREKSGGASPLPSSGRLGRRHAASNGGSAPPPPGCRHAARNGNRAAAFRPLPLLSCREQCGRRGVERVTAGLTISRRHTKNQFADKPEGLQRFRDHHWKALGKYISYL